MDLRFQSFHSLVVGIFGRLYRWWNHLYPAGSCHRLRTDRNYLGARMIVVIQTLAGKGEVFGKEVVSKSRKILPNFRISEY